jgi:hypothetical protein
MRIRLDALRDLVVGAHRFVNVQMRSKLDVGSRQGTSGAITRSPLIDHEPLDR